MLIAHGIYQVAGRFVVESMELKSCAVSLHMHKTYDKETE